ncbi:hypothetical protein [Kitasatospora sp. NPDC090091]|uniref:hypothetical protein n=1 Tax=Kitasatospora sp. NPDC090091 TaxID=3364081 RepID=UPI00381B6B36
MADPHQSPADPHPSPRPRRRRTTHHPAGPRTARPARGDAQREALARLREPFPPEEVSQRPEITCEACRAASFRVCPRHERADCGTCGGRLTSAHVHLDYVGHAAATARLLDVDPLWDWEPLAYTEDGLPRIDRFGGLWIRLTVCGISRLGYGDAAGRPAGTRAVKELVGDAIRNAGMRFGMALNLWAGSGVRVQDEPSPGDVLAARLADDPRLWRSVRGLSRLREEVVEQGQAEHVVAEFDWRMLGEIIDTQIELLAAGASAGRGPAALHPLPTPTAPGPAAGGDSPNPGPGAGVGDTWAGGTGANTAGAGGRAEVVAAFTARMRNGWMQLEPTRMALAEAKAKGLLDDVVPHPGDPQQRGRIQDLLAEQVAFLTARRNSLKEA